MNNPTLNSKQIKTNDFQNFFKSVSWKTDWGNMIKLSNFVSSEYPTLIDFVQYYDTKMCENSKMYCKHIYDVDYDSRDVYEEIFKAIDKYYIEMNKSYIRMNLGGRNDYLDNYKIFQKIKTLFETVKYKSSRDYDHESIIRMYNEYCNDFKNRKEYEKKRIPPPPLPDVHSIFIPLSQRRDDIDTNYENFVPDIDIFVSLRLKITTCNPVCEDPIDEGCCKRVMNTASNIFSKLQNTLLPHNKEKKEGGKTRNKNKKHYSRRCKNRKNKKSCKKPHK